MSAFQSGHCGLPAAIHRRRMTVMFSSLTLRGEKVTILIEGGGRRGAGESLALWMGATQLQRARAREDTAAPRRRARAARHSLLLDARV